MRGGFGGFRGGMGRGGFGRPMSLNRGGMPQRPMNFNVGSMMRGPSQRAGVGFAGGTGGLEQDPWLRQARLRRMGTFGQGNYYG